jgi:putative Mn2+ efflux pump MntP
MSFAAVNVIALGVAMDAFAVAMADGTRPERDKWMSGLATALMFGLAQAGMIALGHGLGDLLWLHAAARVGQGASACILFGIGLHMMLSSEGETPLPAPVLGGLWQPVTLVAEAMAVSVDAFAVGVGMAALMSRILIAAAYIGLVTALLSGVGYFVGYRLGRRCSAVPEFLGGALLIGMAVHILHRMLLL